MIAILFILFISAFQQGYDQGVIDYNNNVNDTSHHFICPLNNHSEYCRGYDAAIHFEFSDQ
jgi:hypothetical protein